MFGLGWRQLLLVLICCVFLGQAGTEPLLAQGTSFALSSQVQANLQRLQLSWQRWVTAYYGGDRSMASAALEELLGIARFLGMERLPDLSVAASAYAVRSANQGEYEQAARALEAAERLDPGRPETRFAAAEVERREGSYLQALRETALGYVALMEQPRQLRLWLAGLALWAIYLAVACGLLFLAVLMTVRGRHLLSGLLTLGRRLFPGPFAVAVVFALLLAPLLLPHGLVWMAALWSILLWRYLSNSQRAVLLVLCLLVGMLPWLLAQQRRHVELHLSPSARLLDHFSDHRLYGTLFQDLDELRATLPSASGVLELEADLHRRLGQWEQARDLYAGLAERDLDNASALVNLGVYHFRKRRYVDALRQFNDALAIDPNRLEALYNKSRSHDLMLEFDRARQPLEQARRLDRDLVQRWEDEQREVVAAEGGTEAVPAVRAELLAASAGAPRWALALGPALLVLALGSLCGRTGTWLGMERRAADEEDWEPAIWLRAAVPGLQSAEKGQGLRGWVAMLIPLSLALLPLAQILGYRSSLGLVPGAWVVAILAIVLLLLWCLVRWLVVRRTGA